MELAVNLRKYRKASGLTQVDFAKKLGTTQAVITNYERGLRKPAADKLPQIVQILGISLEMLYGINGKASPPEKKGEGTRRENMIQKIFRELPPAKQRAVLEHAHSVLERQKLIKK